MSEIYKLLNPGERIMFRRTATELKIRAANELNEAECVVYLEVIEDAAWDIVTMSVNELLQKLRQAH